MLSNIKVEPYDPSRHGDLPRSPKGIANRVWREVFDRADLQPQFVTGVSRAMIYARVKELGLTGKYAITTLNGGFVISRKR